MMNTEIYPILAPNGKEVPIIAPTGIVFPSLQVSDFESYCGAGKGIGDLIVPETCWGVRISPACFVHDVMWDECEASWAAFHQSNSVFLRNIITLIDVQSDSGFLKRLRLYRAVTYYNAVDSFGRSIFWDLKDEQFDVTRGFEQLLTASVNVGAKA